MGSRLAGYGMNSVKKLVQNITVTEANKLINFKIIHQFWLTVSSNVKYNVRYKIERHANYDK